MKAYCIGRFLGLGIAAALSAAVALGAGARALVELAEAEGAAAQDAKPRTYWWWYGDTVTTNGITHDLEAMKRTSTFGWNWDDSDVL